MNEKPYKIYIHINKINNKKYIGQTRQEVQKRWQGGNGYQKCPLFYRAIEKYEWDNFTHLVLYSNLTADEANQYEAALIKLYNTTNPQYGYNISNGGNNSEKPIITRRKISQSLKETYKRKRLENGNITTNKNAKSVVCIETHREYESIAAAAKAYNTTSTTIARACNTNCSCLGYHFIWNPEGLNLAENLKNRKYKRKVVCVENGMIFNSILLAAAATGIEKEDIYSCCVIDDSSTLAGGSHWKFYSD